MREKTLAQGDWIALLKGHAHNEAMARSRRTPPLFEVMRDNDRKGAETHVPARGIPEPTGSQAARGTPQTGARVYPRITTTPDTSGAPPDAVGSPAVAASGTSHQGWKRSGVFVTFAGLGIAAACAVVALGATAWLAYRSGVADERAQLLASRAGPPPGDVETPTETLLPSAPRAQTPQDPIAKKPEPKRQPESRPQGPQLPVQGEDPRQPGTNYLIAAKLFLQDATAAAQYLTDNGVPSVVVPPEGVSPERLLQDRRGNWLVIIREGFSAEAFKTCLLYTSPSPRD